MKDRQHTLSKSILHFSLCECGFSISMYLTFETQLLQKIKKPLSEYNVVNASHPSMFISLGEIKSSKISLFGGDTEKF